VNHKEHQGAQDPLCRGRRQKRAGLARERGEPTDEIEDKSRFHGLDALRYVVAHNRRPMNARWEIGMPPEGQGSIMATAPPGVFGGMSGGRYRNEMDPETGIIRKRPHRSGMDRLREEGIF